MQYVGAVKWLSQYREHLCLSSYDWQNTTADDAMVHACTLSVEQVVNVRKQHCSSYRIIIILCLLLN